jgi:AcrR family transcriptional regulator
MAKRASRKKTQPAPRFDREAWLRAAMEVLARDGQAKLRVDRLAGDLGVTKGSFYHHFENREDFVESLLAYWSSAFTDWVVREVESLEVPADERLLRLMQIIQREGLDRYDIAFRSWAAQDPSVAEQVKKVDLARYDFIRSLFSEMGFEGRDLEDRLRIWLVFHSAQSTVFVPEDNGDAEEAINRRHAFFTRPAE